MAGRLSGKVALVTGAASGIGAASARVIAQEGARVACADINAEGAEAVAKEIARAGGEAIALRLDVADPEDNRRAVEATVTRFGTLQLAHLNAGVAAASNVLDTTLEEWNRTLAINLSGVFYATREALPEMAERGWGRVIHIASIAGKTAMPYIAA
jgi:NAD(P)-dependent dehydrogenase (short-subunit alcohol dehydrogenase family)